MFLLTSSFTDITIALTAPKTYSDMYQVQIPEKNIWGKNNIIIGEYEVKHHIMLDMMISSVISYTLQWPVSFIYMIVVCTCYTV